MTMPSVSMETPQTGNWRVDDLEPRIAEVLDAKLRRINSDRYQAKSSGEIADGVRHMLTAHGLTDFEVDDFHRMGGGASKEQFSFMLRQFGQEPEHLVLRLDPLESIVETCRFREDEIFLAMTGRVATPTTKFVDGEGHHLGQPCIITSFVDGVTKPPANGRVLSGVGTSFSTEWQDRLAPQFLDNLVQIHATDWQRANLSHFQAPTAHPWQAALWQVNWWTQIWRQDQRDPYPILTIAEQWMRERLPQIESSDLVLLHGDFRTGNFMFDAESGQFTAVLDWELSHIGDFHEDLGWMVQRLFAGVNEHGRLLICNLMTREELIEQYEALTGRSVNHQTLAFYELLSAYKIAAMNLGTGYSAAVRGHSHQDVLLSLLSSVGHVCLGEIADIIERED